MNDIHHWFYKIPSQGEIETILAENERENIYEMRLHNRSMGIAAVSHDSEQIVFVVMIHKIVEVDIIGKAIKIWIEHAKGYRSCLTLVYNDLKTARRDLERLEEL